MFAQIKAFPLLSLVVLFSSTALAVTPVAPSNMPLTLGGQQAKLAEKEAKEFTRLPISWKALDKDKANAAKAWKIIQEVNQGRPMNSRKLHIVYVTFKDRAPLPEYHERYDHIFKNIQAYYADQMRENGFPPLTFALDLDENGKVKIFDAHVDVPMEQVTVNSAGPLSRDAAKKVLSEHGIDAEQNHIVVICQLPDGVGPYYGGGLYASGTGWTCDQEGLDPNNFLKKEYFGGRYNTSFGQNASIYIGGTAHELGHSFGLSHTMEGWEYPNCGYSLMGIGNHTYANELRGEGGGSFLSPTDAMMLASVPLFNGYDTPTGGKFSPAVFKDVKIESIPDGVKLSGILGGDKKAYALIVHLDPPGTSDYDANAVACIPEKDGHFNVEIRRPGHKGFIDLRMSPLFVDGSRGEISSPSWMTNGVFSSPILEQQKYFGKVNQLWANRDTQGAQKELNQVIAKAGNEKIVKEFAPVWQRALKAENPAFLNTPLNVPSDTKQVSLVDCQPSETKVGWAVPRWDVMLPSNSGPDAYFQSTGRLDRFIMIHAPGHLRYDLGGGWDELTAHVGLPCGNPDGSVKFIVKGDGKVLMTSRVLNSSESEQVKVPVKGIKVLEIIVQDAGDGNTADMGVIGNPMLTR
ncbi:MAG: NPCBM/NEW2 domain-containing protein [Akkermansia sp.]